MILPMSVRIARVSAQLRGAPVKGLAGVRPTGSNGRAVMPGATPGGAACQYRYPSPIGQPLVPNSRLPVFSSRSRIAGVQDRRQRNRCVAAAELFSSLGVSIRRTLQHEGRYLCSRKPGFSPVCFAPVSQHVVTPSANRPCSAAPQALAQQPSLAAASAAAPWSAQPATWPTARPTPAPAAKAFGACAVDACDGAAIAARLTVQSKACPSLRLPRGGGFSFARRTAPAGAPRPRGGA